MQDATGNQTGIIHFTGLDFRQEHVDCAQCGWGGQAGGLRSAASATLGDTVTYACPKCSRTLATHDGLSVQEVLQEMQEIRKVLAAETTASLVIPEEEGAEEQEVVLDFEEVRAQLRPAIQTEDDPDQVADVADEFAKQHADESIAPATPVTQEPFRNELSYAEVRARLEVSS
jgi:hypothetical protein